MVPDHTHVVGYWDCTRGGKMTYRCRDEAPDIAKKKKACARGRRDGAGRRESGCAGLPGATRIGAAARADGLAVQSDVHRGPGRSISKPKGGFSFRSVPNRAVRPTTTTPSVLRPSPPAAAASGSELVTVVGHHDELSRLVFRSTPVGENAGRRGMRQIGQHFDDRAQLGVAVLGPLRPRRRSRSTRCLMKTWTVDLGQVDAALGTRGGRRRGHRSHQPDPRDIQGEVVACARRYADGTWVSCWEATAATIACAAPRRP